MSTYRGDREVGSGVHWSADRQTAWRLLDGAKVAEISLDEARALAARIGLPVPPPPGGSYVGERNAAGGRDGRGTTTYPDHSVFDGQYKNDMKHGAGTMTYANGVTDVANFREGHQVGEAVSWGALRRKAWRLRDGEAQDEISLDEARELMARIGLPVPPPVRAPN